MAEEFLMKNEDTGATKKTYIGYSWTMLLFNIFAPLFRGDFKTFFILLALNVAVYIISPNIIFLYLISFMPGFIYSFLWNKEYTKRLLSQGYIFSESEEKNSYAITKLNTPNKAGYIFCTINCILSLLVAIQFTDIDSKSFNTSSFLQSSSYEAAYQKIDKSNISSISPYDRNLISLFKVPSEYTDIQRENMLNKIKGKVVSWKLPVYEISREADNVYKVTTEASSSSVGAIIYITANLPEEKNTLLSLKTGSDINFIGVLTGETFLRYLIIRPAELIMPERISIYGKLEPGGTDRRTSIGDYYYYGGIDGIDPYEYCEPNKNCNVDALVIGDEIKYIYNAQPVNIRSGNFSFVSCGTWEGGISYIELKNIKNSKNVQMIIDENMCKSIASKLGSGERLNVTYGTRLIQEHPDDEPYESIEFIKYKILESKNNSKKSKSNANILTTKFAEIYLPIGWNVSKNPDQDIKDIKIMGNSEYDKRPIIDSIVFTSKEKKSKINIRYEDWNGLNAEMIARVISGWHPSTLPVNQDSGWYRFETNIGNKTVTCLVNEHNGKGVIINMYGDNNELENVLKNIKILN